jgi:IS5 family transposase
LLDHPTSVGRSKNQFASIRGEIRFRAGYYSSPQRICHSVSTTTANVHDITKTSNLLHSEECFVSADSGYRVVQKREELKDVKADWLIAAFFEKMGKQNKNLKKT